MIWIMTAFLCAGLLGALVLIMHPHLLAESIGKRWRNSSFYKRH